MTNSPSSSCKVAMGGSLSELVEKGFPQMSRRASIIAIIASTFESNVECRAGGDTCSLTYFCVESTAGMFSPPNCTTVSSDLVVHCHGSQSEPFGESEFITGCIASE